MVARQLPKPLGRAEFYERVAEGFRLLAAEEPERWVIVDGDRPMEEVAVAVRNTVLGRLDL